MIVTDLSMPKLSGTELCQKVRETNTHIPILLSAGQLGSSDIETFKKLGISDVIQKPWSIVDLINRMGALAN